MSIRPLGPSSSPSSVPPATPTDGLGSSTDGASSPSGQGAPSAAPAVHLSPSVQALQVALKDTSRDVDVAQVEAVRQEVLAGTYQINPRAIADGLLASVRDLLRTRPRRARREA